MIGRPLSAIDVIVLHCSATSRSRTTIDDVRQWHQAQGWDDVGYHYFIRTNGLLEYGRPLDVVGSHVKGHNRNSIGICLNGLLEQDFTVEQFDSLRGKLRELKLIFPHAQLLGHNELDPNKECPVFDLAPWKDFWNEDRN